MAEQPRWQNVGKSAAEGYEQLLVPAIFSRWAQTLIDAAAVQPGQSVLDVACGTGVVARLVAERVGEAGQVVGLDFNAGMLDVARSLPVIPGATIAWCEASAFDMPLPDADFDVVLCQQGLQQFSDRPGALREMHRVLRPGGRLGMSVWTAIEGSPSFAALADALERHVSDAAAANRRATFALGDGGEIERLVNDAGFREVTIRKVTGTTHFPSVEKFVEYLLASGPAAMFADIPADTLAAVVRDVREAVRVYVTDDGLVSPSETHIVLART